MYFKKVEIQNYRSIQDMQIHLNPGVNLLIGDNGVGKTAVLEALTVALGGFLSGIPGVSTKGILQTDIRIESSPLSNASMGIQYKVPVSVGCVMDIDGDEYVWSRIRGSESGDSRTKITDRRIARYSRDITNDLSSRLPLLSYMGTVRVSQTKRQDFGSNLKKKLNDRRCGYIGCLDSALDIKAINAWCLKMEMAAFQQENRVAEYEAFKKMVASFMMKMSENSYLPEIKYARQFEDIVYVENQSMLPVSYLSAGYQSLLWIAMDIAYRMAILNPGIQNFEDLTGIVLIDELDMHLHPKWQWNVLSVLEELFPHLQFIIATHSPILISSCKNENLIHIDSEQNISYPDSAYAYSIEDV